MMRVLLVVRTNAGPNSSKSLIRSSIYSDSYFSRRTATMENIIIFAGPKYLTIFGNVYNIYKNVILNNFYIINRITTI